MCGFVSGDWFLFVAVSSVVHSVWRVGDEDVGVVEVVEVVAVVVVDQGHVIECVFYCHGGMITPPHPNNEATSPRQRCRHRPNQCLLGRVFPFERFYDVFIDGSLCDDPDDGDGVCLPLAVQSPVSLLV